MKLAPGIPGRVDALSGIRCSGSELCRNTSTDTGCCRPAISDADSAVLVLVLVGARGANTLPPAQRRRQRRHRTLGIEAVRKDRVVLVRDARRKLRRVAVRIGCR